MKKHTWRFTILSWIVMGLAVHCHSHSEGEDDPVHPANQDPSPGQSPDKKVPASTASNPKDSRNDQRPLGPAGKNKDTPEDPWNSGDDSSKTIRNPSVQNPSDPTASLPKDATALADGVTRGLQKIVDMSSQLGPNGSSARSILDEARSTLEDALRLISLLSPTDTDDQSAIQETRIRTKLTIARSSLSRASTTAINAGAWTPSVQETYQAIVLHLDEMIASIHKNVP